VRLALLDLPAASGPYCCCVTSSSCRAMKSQRFWLRRRSAEPSARACRARFRIAYVKHHALNSCPGEAPHGGRAGAHGYPPGDVLEDVCVANRPVRTGPHAYANSSHYWHDERRPAPRHPRQRRRCITATTADDTLMIASPSICPPPRDRTAGRRVQPSRSNLKRRGRRGADKRAIKARGQRKDFVTNEAAVRYSRRQGTRG